MRVLAHGPIEEFDGGAVFLEFLDQQYLMDVGASQAVRACDQDAVEAGACDSIAQPVEPRALQAGATGAIVAKDGLGGQICPLRESVGSQPFDLLFSRLTLNLALGGGADISGED